MDNLVYKNDIAYISAQDLASYLEIKLYTLKYHLNTYDIPYIEIGSIKLYRLTEVQTLVDVLKFKKNKKG